MNQVVKFGQIDGFEPEDTPMSFIQKSNIFGRPGDPDDKKRDASNTPGGPKITPLSPVEKDVIAYIETAYQGRGKFPRASTIKTKFDRDLSALCRHDSFLLALSVRGIPVPASYLTGSSLDMQGHLTTEQVNTVMVLTDFHDARTRVQKFRSLGINTTTFNGWMKDTAFKQFFETMSLRNFKDGVHIAREGLMKAIDRGEVAAVKYYMELHGESPEVQNIRTMLARLIEVIQLHVPNTETLYRIEQDFKRVMSGQSAEPDVAYKRYQGNV